MQRTFISTRGLLPVLTMLIVTVGHSLAADDPEASDGGDTNIVKSHHDPTDGPIVRPVNQSEDAQPGANLPPPVRSGEPERIESGDPDSASVGGQFYGAPGILFEDVPYTPWVATRFGWWGVDTSGSKAGVGEWMGLDKSSPFFDVDGITSNGFRTFDFFATGTENDTSQGDFHFFDGPGLTADLKYSRFPHRTGHDPIIFPQGGFYDPPLTNGDPGYVMYGTDLNPGQDYAIRVQQIQAKFEGTLTDNIKWGLKIWGMRKEGIRQVNSTQHCFANTPAPGGRTCHVVSQSQQIDWLTMEIEPVIKARFDWLSAEYSRTMRSFQQNDQFVFNDFTSVSSTYGLQAVGVYGVVPDNYTEIDRVKLNGQLTPNTEVYAVGHLGNTHNKLRESDRKFYGVDVRLMNDSLPGLSLTAYGKTYSQRNSPDITALNTRYPDQAGNFLEANPPQTFYATPTYYLSLADRDTMTAGAKGRWRPFFDDDGLFSRLAVTGGYEFKRVERGNVSYVLDSLGTFTQPNTESNMFFVGMQQDWSYAFSTYVRYRMIDTQSPLLGITHRQQLSLDAAINSNQPEREDRIEFGGNWSPIENLLLNASVWIQSSYHHSEYVNFDEDNYPIVVSAWYAPNDRWSFSGGIATFSNWIEQDVTLGREDGSSGTELTAFTSTWNYAGRADVLNLGAAYAWTRNVTLTGGLEYVRSRNLFATPPSPATAVTDYSDLPVFSMVRVNTWRLSAGFDYLLSQNISSFVRYNYFDYGDVAMSYNAGTASMILGGVNAVY